MKKIIATPNAPAAIGPYAQTVDGGSVLITSGQLGLDPATGELADGVVAQAKQSLTNLKAVLEAAGSGLDKVVKTTVFLKHISDFNAVNEVYASFFTDGAYPARSAVEVAALPKGGLVEIEAIAEK